MTAFYKIDKATGDILERRDEPGMPGRAFDKSAVWLEVKRFPEPGVNPDTHKAVMVRDMPDLSDVSEKSKVVERFETVALSREEKLENVRNKRARAYPPIGDQLDGILKALNQMQLDGFYDLPAETDAIINKWLAVKRDHPKPE